MCNKSTVLLDLYKINSNMLYQLIQDEKLTQRTIIFLIQIVSSLQAQPTVPVYNKVAQQKHKII